MSVEPTVDHALSLSFDGIALYARAAAQGGPAEGWYLLGEVPLDMGDLPAALAALRAKAADGDGGAPAVKLILPNDQIRYLDLPRDAAAPEAQAAAALDGATPYAVEDLVIDWTETGDRLQVAAVARETLQEAEAFAKEHGFAPASFVAMGAEDRFAREPHFGPTEAARQAGWSQVPGPRQISVIPGPPPAPPERSGQPRPLDETVQPLAEVGEDGQPADRDAARADGAAEKTETDAGAAPALETGDADGAGAGDDMTRSAAADAGRADDASQPAAAVNAPLADVAAPSQPRQSAPFAARRADAEGDAPPIAFSSLRAERGEATRPSRAPQATAASITADATTPGLGAQGKAPPIDRADRDAPAQGGAPSFADAIRARAEESLAARSADASEAAAPARSARATPARGGILGRKRRAEAAAPSPTAAAAGVGEGQMSEAERMTVFGARRKDAPAIGGKPRFLGLVLTAALLLFLLGVAAWATIFVDDGLARFFDPDAESAVQTESALSAPRLPTPGPDEAESAVDAAPTQPPARDPAEEDFAAGEAIDADPQGPAPRAAPLDLPGAIPDLPDAAPLQAPPETDLAALSPGLPAVAAPPVAGPAGLSRPLGGAVLGPEEAAARYAATGIWQRSPEPPSEPPQGLLDDLRLAGRDSAAPMPDLVRLPAADRFATDRALPAQDLPPRASERFDFDARGLIRPTAEGVVAPGGYTLVRGRPDLLPEPRTPLAQPAAPDTAAAEAAPTGPTDARAIALPDPDLAARRPLLRPDGVAPDRAEPPSDQPPGTPDGVAAAPDGTGDDGTGNDATEPDATAETAVADTAGAAAFAAPPDLTRIRPEPRPESIAGRADEAAAEDAAPENAEQDEARVARSLAPVARPANIATLISRADAAAAAQRGALVTRQATQVSAAVTPREVAPPAPSRQSVARAATQDNAINLRRVNLIGVYGTPSDRRALVRLSNGRFQKVKVGDALDGGRILAISDTQLRYQKSGRNLVLDLPQG